MEEELLKKLYYEEGLSFRDIGLKFGKSMKFTQHWMNKYNLKPRTASESSKLRCKKKPQTNPGRKGMPKRRLYGKDNPGYKGGFIRKDGYKVISVNGKPKLEHRDIWEKHHCKIPRGYQIHHKNGDKEDNRIENLQMITNAEHQKFHDTPRDCKGKFIKQ